MAEVGAEDIERDPLARGIGGIGEGELRVGIAEALDEPGGGDPVDVRSRTRYPGAPPRGQRRAVAPAPCRARTCFRGAQPLGGRLPEAAGARSRRRLQVVDGLNPVQLTLQTVELAAEPRDRSAVVRRVAIEVPEDLPTPLHHRLILDTPGLVEEVGDLLVGHRLDSIDAKQRRLAADGLDFLDEPLEELGRLGRLGQDPARPPQPHGPHPLQLSPHPDAMPGRRGGQGRQEGQPAHRVSRNP